MSVAKSMTACPYCKEPIAAGATKCKHCQSDLASVSKKKRSFFARLDTFRLGFATGIVFTIIVGVLIYLQFQKK
jgi:hypothetical protein